MGASCFFFFFSSLRRFRTGLRGICQERAGRACDAFADHILPRSSDLWVQASLDYRHRLQQLFVPEEIAFDRFNRTAATAPLFRYLAPSESADAKMVSQIFASWNHLDGWLRQLQGSNEPHSLSLGCAAGSQETRDVREPVLRCPHNGRLAVRVLR